jgi:thiamine biosynthesis lipoprotein
MNTDVTLYVRSLDDVGLLAAAEEVFHSLERRLSRFKPESELCRLNDRSGRDVPVSETMIDILRRAQKLHAVTGGVFEPAVLPDLEAAGYDRSFEHVAPVAQEQPPRGRAQACSIAQLHVDFASRTVRGPAGLRIDLGGIGKGYAVDTAMLLLAPARDFVVSAGGDMFASGCGPDDDGWLVSVVDPFGSGTPVSLVRLYDQALATSTTAVRRWQRGGRLHHHLIDPATRRPAESGVISVTVIAGSATEADVFAKTGLLLGADRGLAFLEEQDAPGLFVLDDGGAVHTAGWPGTRQPAAQSRAVSS